MKDLRRLKLFATVMLVLGGCNARTSSTPVMAIADPVKADPVVQPAPVPDMKETLVYLASDEQEGRGIGTAGLDRAAQYIADRFAVLGLQPPPGMHDYFQPFDMQTGSKVNPATQLRTIDKSFKLGQDYSPMMVSGSGTFDAPAVFVGYGISSKDEKYDDYAGTDVHGKVAIVLRYEPHDANGKSLFTHADWTGNAALIAKARAAADHGAIALVIVNPPDIKADDDLSPFTPVVSGRAASIPVVQMKREAVAELFKQANLDLTKLEKEIDSTDKPHSQNMGNAGLSGNVVIDHATAHVKNVMAYLPGTGPHKDEFIVVGAHYDHLGRGGLVPGSKAGKAIYHGADDNASGTTAMLELARRARSDGPHDRSILFMAYTGEEEGLIGSEYFADHPTVPLNKITYMLNLDMVGRMKDNIIYTGGEGTAADLETLLNTADKGTGLTIKSMGKGGLGPSDHMTFALHKIPVIFLFTGFHPDYHRPTDTWDKINYTGMAETVDLAEKIMNAMCSAPREQYVAKYDTHSMSIGMGGSKVTLGVVPDYVDDPKLNGLKINGTMEGSPAAKAGLQAGDVITQFGDKKIGNIYDLTDALANSKPGQFVKLKLLRNGKPIELSATLAERKG